ncbi:MAG TPA: prenyltransferase [Dehalococcoidia bacterium]|nr:prenyltransferase [Dehalococcoidia bacterium]
MTTATKTLTGPKLWLEALRTVPQVNTAEVDPLSRWLILGRVSVVVMSAISAVIGGLLAARDDVFDLPLLILVALGLVLAHTGSNLVNDFMDYRHGIDSPDSPRVNYGPHPFSGEGHSLREFVLVTVLVLAAAAAIGIYLVAAAGAGVLAFALTGALLLLFYSGGPFPLKYIGLGEIAVFVIWGPLMIGGTYYVMAEELPAWVLLASVPYGLGVTTVLFGKHLDKLDFDREKGIRTMPIVLGESLARHVTVVLSVLMYISAAALAVWEEMWALVLVAGAVPLLLLVLRFYRNPKPKRAPEGYRGWPLWFVAVAFIHNRRFGLLFVAGLALQLAAEAVL